MLIQVNTDANIEGRESFANYVEAEIGAALQRFGDRITRVEVHLSDASSGKAGGKRCLIEVRLAGLQPLTATADNAGLEDAISDAASKMQRLLESTLGRLDETKGSASIRTDAPEE